MDLPKANNIELKEKLDLLNNRLRKCINYKTPNELIKNILLNVALDLTNYRLKK